MKGFVAIYRKELADHFSSYRFLILFALIAMVSLITAYLAGMNMAKALEGRTRPTMVFLHLFTSAGAGFSLVQFVTFFGPLLGLLLGFDAINRERNEGTLSKLLSQPIYRDAVINAKFLAAVTLIALMLTAIVLVITGLGMLVLGIVPDAEALGRIIIYLVLSIVYISLWLAVAILLSILLRSVATSALAALAIWIFFSFFVSIGANAIANALTADAPPDDPGTIVKQTMIENAISILSPMVLYTNATATIVDPARKTTRSVIQVGMMEQLSMARFSGPLPLGQSLLVVLPNIIFLVCLTVICFAASYMAFMRQEIRSL